MSEQPTKLSNKRRIYVYYYNIQGTDEVTQEAYLITGDAKQAKEWASEGGRVVEYARGVFVKG